MYEIIIKNETQDKSKRLDHFLVQLLININTFLEKNLQENIILTMYVLYLFQIFSSIFVDCVSQSHELVKHPPPSQLPSFESLKLELPKERDLRSLFSKLKLS